MLFLVLSHSRQTGMPRLCQSPLHSTTCKFSHSLDVLFNRHKLEHVALQADFDGIKGMSCEEGLRNQVGLQSESNLSIGARVFHLIADLEP